MCFFLSLIVSLLLKSQASPSFTLRSVTTTTQIRRTLSEKNPIRISVSSLSFTRIFSLLSSPRLTTVPAIATKKTETLTKFVSDFDLICGTIDLNDNDGQKNPSQSRLLHLCRMRLFISGAAKIVPTPSRVDCLNDIQIKMIALGVEHSIAVTDEGEVLSWGAGGSGRLGHGHQSSILGFLKSTKLDK